MVVVNYINIVPKKIFIALDENYNIPAYFKVILRANMVYSSRGNRETLS